MWAKDKLAVPKAKANMLQALGNAKDPRNKQSKGVCDANLPGNSSLYG